MKKLLIVLAVLLALTLTVIVAIVSVAGRDIPAPDLSDLRLHREAIAPEDNAGTYFLRATNTLHWPAESLVVTRFLNAQPVDPKALENMLSSNDETLALIRRGTECRRLLYPEIVDYETLLPYIGPWRDIGRLMAAKTRHQRLAGQAVEATDTCLVLLRFGHLVQRDAEGLVHYLVGLAILESGFTQALDLVRDPATPAGEIRRLSSGLGAAGSFDTGLIRAIQGEHKIADKLLKDWGDGTFDMGQVTALGGSTPPRLLKGKRVPRYFFQPNKTRLAFANIYRNIITNAPRSYTDMDVYDVETALGLNRNRAALMVRPNAVGKMIHGLLAPALESLLERKCRAECNTAAIRLLGALHVYRKDTGTLPGTLQDLVPTCIDAVPTDPFDGQFFRYKPKESVLYSVGKDGKDSGGSAAVPSNAANRSRSQRRWNAEDIVFEIDIGRETPTQQDLARDREGTTNERQ